MNLFKDLISSVIQPVADAYKSRQERKAVQESAKIKLELAKSDAQHKVDLTDAEWEALAVQTTPSSWKDEYVTIVATAPLVGIIVGSLWAAFTGNTQMLEGMNTGLTNLNAIGVDMGEIISVVIYAAVGLKFWRSR